MYALPTYALVLTVDLPQPATVADALAAAAHDIRFADLDLLHAAVGVFGKAAARAEPLREGDRVEIYRGPAADAKAARRARIRISRANRKIEGR